MAPPLPVERLTIALRCEDAHDPQENEHRPRLADQRTALAHDKKRYAAIRR
jgi:hypothetical protein